tara:strand:- start:23378 stop:24205 length:828 start_codon:yes stop_codon:yes gene_type:complete
MVNLMRSAKDIVVKPINARSAAALVKKIHYSGKVVQNSSLHFGVFLDGKLEGAMQFGTPMDKRKSLGLVEGTTWNEMIELNRMAFSDKLPRFSESRAIGIAMRMMRKHYPQLKWVQSFSDGTMCGDGTIYRASGFVLTGINQNSTIYVFPDGARIASLTLTNGGDLAGRRKVCEKYGAEFTSKASMKPFIDIGAKKATGFMLRYMYFLDKSYIDKLTVPILPFSDIDKMGAGMYKGETVTLQERKLRDTRASSSDQLEGGGSIPTITLQSPKDKK